MKEITFSMSGTAILLLGWDAGVNHLKDEEPELVKAINSAKEVKRGRGYSLIVTCPAKVAQESIYERLELYAYGYGITVTPNERQTAKRICEEIQRNIKQ